MKDTHFFPLQTAWLWFRFSSVELILWAIILLYTSACVSFEQVMLHFDSCRILRTTDVAGTCPRQKFNLNAQLVSNFDSIVVDRVAQLRAAVSRVNV